MFMVSGSQAWGDFVTPQSITNTAIHLLSCFHGWDCGCDTVDFSTTQGLGALTLRGVEKQRIILQAALCIYGSASMDSTSRGSCSTVVCL